MKLRMLTRITAIIVSAVMMIAVLPGESLANLGAVNESEAIATMTTEQMDQFGLTVGQGDDAVPLSQTYLDEETGEATSVQLEGDTIVETPVETVTANLNEEEFVVKDAVVDENKTVEVTNIEETAAEADDTSNEEQPADLEAQQPDDADDTEEPAQQAGSALSGASVANTGTAKADLTTVDTTLDTYIPITTTRTIVYGAPATPLYPVCAWAASAGVQTMETVTQVDVMSGITSYTATPFAQSETYGKYGVGLSATASFTGSNFTEKAFDQYKQPYLYYSIEQASDATMTAYILVKRTSDSGTATYKWWAITTGSTSDNKVLSTSNMTQVASAMQPVSPTTAWASSAPSTPTTTNVNSYAQNTANGSQTGCIDLTQYLGIGGATYNSSTSGTGITSDYRRSDAYSICGLAFVMGSSHYARINYLTVGAGPAGEKVSILPQSRYIYNSSNYGGYYEPTGSQTNNSYITYRNQAYNYMSANGYTWPHITFVHGKAGGADLQVYPDDTDAYIHIPVHKWVDVAQYRTISYSLTGTNGAKVTVFGGSRTSYSSTGTSYDQSSPKGAQWRENVAGTNYSAPLFQLILDGNTSGSTTLTASSSNTNGIQGNSIFNGQTFTRISCKTATAGTFDAMECDAVKRLTSYNNRNASGYYQWIFIDYIEVTSSNTRVVTINNLSFDPSIATTGTTGTASYTGSTGLISGRAATYAPAFDGNTQFLGSLKMDLMPSVTENHDWNTYTDAQRTKYYLTYANWGGYDAGHWYSSQKYTGASSGAGASYMKVANTTATGFSGVDFTICWDNGRSTWCHGQYKYASATTVAATDILFFNYSFFRNGNDLADFAPFCDTVACNFAIWPGSGAAIEINNLMVRLGTTDVTPNLNTSTTSGSFSKQRLNRQRYGYIKGQDLIDLGITSIAGIQIALSQSAASNQNAAKYSHIIVEDLKLYSAPSNKYSSGRYRSNTSAQYVDFIDTAHNTQVVYTSAATTNNGINNMSTQNNSSASNVGSGQSRLGQWSATAAAATAVDFTYWNSTDGSGIVNTNTYRYLCFSVTAPAANSFAWSLIQHANKDVDIITAGTQRVVSTANGGYSTTTVSNENATNAFYASDRITGVIDLNGSNLDVDTLRLHFKTAGTYYINYFVLSTTLPKVYDSEVNHYAYITSNAAGGLWSTAFPTSWNPAGESTAQYASGTATSRYNPLKTTRGNTLLSGVQGMWTAASGTTFANSFGYPNTDTTYYKWSGTSGWYEGRFWTSGSYTTWSSGTADTRFGNDAVLDNLTLFRQGFARSAPAITMSSTDNYNVYCGRNYSPGRTGTATNELKNDASEIKWFVTTGTSTTTNKHYVTESMYSGIFTIGATTWDPTAHTSVSTWSKCDVRTRAKAVALGKTNSSFAGGATTAKCKYLWCEMTNAGGTSTSAKTQIRAYYPPVAATTMTTDYGTIYADETGTYTVGIPADASTYGSSGAGLSDGYGYSAGTPTYYWEYSTDGGSTWTAITDATTLTTAGTAAGLTSTAWNAAAYSFTPSTVFTNSGAVTLRARAYSTSFGYTDAFKYLGYCTTTTPTIYRQYNVTYDGNGGVFTQNGKVYAKKLRKNIWQNYAYGTGLPTDSTSTRRASAVLGTAPTALAAGEFSGNVTDIKFSRLGYTLSGWYYYNDSGTQVNISDINTELFPGSRTKNITLYANWTATSSPSAKARLYLTSSSSPYNDISGARSNNYEIVLPQNNVKSGKTYKVQAWQMRVSRTGAILGTYSAGEKVRIGIYGATTYFTPTTSATAGTTHTIKVYGGKLYKDRNRKYALGTTSSSGSGASQLNTYTVNDGQWLCAYPNSGTTGYWRMLNGTGGGTAQDCSRTATYVFAAEGDIYLSYLSTAYSGNAVMALNPQIGVSKATDAADATKTRVTFKNMLQYELISGATYSEMGIIYTTANLWSAKGNAGSPTASDLTVDSTNRAVYQVKADATPSMTRQIDVTVNSSSTTSATSRTFYAIGYVKYTYDGNTYYQYSNMYTVTYTASV
ncbi:MAG: hypothetical protein IJU16_08325 [Clostridia bacterium]|nr:hypothetical protein [Clostridia bacterium]